MMVASLIWTDRAIGCSKRFASCTLDSGEIMAVPGLSAGTAKAKAWAFVILSHGTTRSNQNLVVKGVLADMGLGDSVDNAILSFLSASLGHQ